jgi:hypothetical protein
MTALAVAGTTGVLILVGVITGCGTDTAAATSTAPKPTADLHAAPTGVKWERFQGVPVPSAQQGPRLVDGPVAVGFDESPAGAALAAIQATIRMSVADNNQWPQVGNRMLAPGPGRDAWATARAQISIDAAVTAAQAPQVVGYTLIDYTPVNADVAIYTRHSDMSLTRNTAHVVRRDDNWLLALPDNADAPRVAAVPETPPDMVWLPL